MTTEYTVEVQKLFLEMMMMDPQTFVRVQSIFKSKNFDRSLRKAAEFINEHADDYSTMPTFDQVNASCGTKLKPVPELNEGHIDWLLHEFESFSRRQELERAILEAADLLEKGEYNPVEKMIKDAVQVSLQRDLGTDYWDDPRARLLAIKDNNGQVSTGWPALDRKLYGGFNRGELQIFAGGSGSGKSLFMQNIAVNWIAQGLNGVFLSLELSEELCAMRMDSMITEIPSKEILKNIDDVELKVKMKGKQSGRLWIKYMPAQRTINDIKSYLKELQIQKGKKIDFIMVDYLDLLMPVSAKVSPNDQFVKDKYVSEELRNLAKEFELLLVTASQLNRSAVEEIELDHSHIAGGISKINTADNVFAIYTSRAMKERGRYQLQLIKTRNSGGVGSKVDLDFNVDNLRIVDVDEDDDYTESTGSSILNKIRNSEPTSEPSGETGKVTADIKSNKLKGMLAQLNNS